MSLTKLTDTDNQCVLVRLDQIACAYPADLYAPEAGEEFGVAETNCTKISMINGDVLHVKETPEDIFAMTQADN